MARPMLLALLVLSWLRRVHGFQQLRQQRRGALGQLQGQARNDDVDLHQQQQQQQKRRQLVLQDEDRGSAWAVSPVLSTTTVSRQRWLRSCLGLGVAAVSIGMVAQDASAAAPPAGGGDQKDTIWLTGKDPVVPGQALRDKSDVKGTRKDPNFLRSISDCKSQCENSAGPDGLARSKETCLSECQDICCQTYQQCTFGIVPRI
jgi:hypothetical protein